MAIWMMLGISAAVLTTFSFIPQIIKVIRTKSTKSLSPITLIQLSSGVGLWVLYGIYRKDPIIIFANGITLLSLLALLFLYFYYRKQRA